MYDARTRLAAAVADEVREHFRDQVLRTAIPRSVRVSEAPSYGQSVMTYDPASPGALSYLEAARELAHRGAGAAGEGIDEQDQPARRGLGRGLGSLIPTGPPPPGGPREERLGGSLAVAETPVTPARSVGTSRAQGRRSRPASPAPTSPSCRSTSIAPNARQPREVFDEEAMAELVHSIREVGLLQPVVVRRTGEDAYELIMGERRWRAAQEAGLETIPAIVRQTDDDDMLRDALLENLHRSQLNPWRRRPPTGSCSTTSAAPTTSWPAGSGAAAHRSATPCGC